VDVVFGSFGARRVVPAIDPAGAWSCRPLRTEVSTVQILEGSANCSRAAALSACPSLTLDLSFDLALRDRLVPVNEPGARNQDQP
jgi:hypothetical protein